MGNDQLAPGSVTADALAVNAVTKTDIGLSNVDNTSDVDKPLSSAMQNALAAKANDTAVLHLSGTETVSGVKTFSQSPLVPLPTQANQAASKSYVDIQVTPAPPAGFVRIKGNSKFGTSDFFVMKYQAKNGGSNNPVSTAAGTPWVNISQRDAADRARALGPGYHLITEAEWMTIATDALWQNSNWTSGTVGTGSLYTGHKNNTPANALEASTDDGDGYFGTGNTAPSTQRRTLNLSNGEVIWDISGNVWEWTDATIFGQDQPTVAGSDDSASSYFGWRQWTAINKRLGTLNYAMPTNRGWNSTQGLGHLYSRDDTAASNTNATQYGFLRGGPWNAGTYAGVFALLLSSGPTYTHAQAGFRVARSI